jgi:hypothetical protein
MEKTLKFLDKWGTVIVMFLLIMVFMKDCSTAKRIGKVEKKTTELCAKVDSLDAKTICAGDVKKLIKTTSATQTLIDEELIDKKQLSLTDLYKELQ